MVASDPTVLPRYVILLPIARTPPTSNMEDIEIPVRVKQALGFDEAASWVIVSEHNVDEWPNGGLSPLPGRPATFSHGFIPPGLFAQIKARFLELAHSRKSHTIRR